MPSFFSLQASAEPNLRHRIPFSCSHLFSSILYSITTYNRLRPCRKGNGNGCCCFVVSPSCTSGLVHIFRVYKIRKLSAKTKTKKTKWLSVACLVPRKWIGSIGCSFEFGFQEWVLTFCEYFCEYAKTSRLTSAYLMLALGVVLCCMTIINAMQICWYDTGYTGEGYNTKWWNDPWPSFLPTSGLAKITRAEVGEKPLDFWLHCSFANFMDHFLRLVRFSCLNDSVTRQDSS